MDQVTADRTAYDLALRFMHSLDFPGVDAALIDKYLHPDLTKGKPTEIRDLYWRLLFHAQNANMKAKVIGGSIGGVEKLGQVLFDFDPRMVESQFKGWEQVLDRIEHILKPRGEVRRTGRSLWPLYCQTILSAANFMNQFPTADDFHHWVSFFDSDSRARPALPLLIDREVFGVGFALACDFLKEMGYQGFSKPDVHIKDIFEALGLSKTREDFEVFRAVARVAEAVGKSPFCVDKLFWLIGSGYFYGHPDVGNKGRIGSQKEKFIALAAHSLKGHSDKQTIAPGHDREEETESPMD